MAACSGFLESLKEQHLFKIYNPAAQDWLPTEAKQG